MDVAPKANAAQVMQMDDHAIACHAEAPPPAQPGDALCDAHCDQGTPSPDVARIPALPALPAWVPSGPVAVLPALAAQTRRRLDSPPPIPWNGPTPHPSALLLI